MLSPKRLFLAMTWVETRTFAQYLLKYAANSEVEEQIIPQTLVRILGVSGILWRCPGSSWM